MIEQFRFISGTWGRFWILSRARGGWPVSASREVPSHIVLISQYLLHRRLSQGFSDTARASFCASCNEVRLSCESFVARRIISASERPHCDGSRAMVAVIVLTLQEFRKLKNPASARPLPFSEGREATAPGTRWGLWKSIHGP
jgi:hypothetical protein